MMGGGGGRKPLDYEELNENVKKVQYAVRGELYLRASELQKEGKKIIFTNVGNPHALGQKPLTFPRQVVALCQAPFLLDDPNVGLIFPADAIARAKHYLSMAPGGLGAYSDSRGIPGVRKEVAEFIQRRDGYPSDPELIYLTDGASKGVMQMLNTIIRNDRDGILVPVPQYPLYSAAISLFGGSLVPYYLEEEANWGLDFVNIRQSVASARSKGITVRAMVIINPGNPTGQCLSEANIRELLNFCYQENLVLLADEVYQQNIYQDERPFMSARKVSGTVAFEVLHRERANKVFGKRSARLLAEALARLPRRSTSANRHRLRFIHTVPAASTSANRSEQNHRTCPVDLKEAIASVIFASMRCSDVTELADVRKHFTNKYGKEFAAAALEVRPDSGVNRLVIEKLSAGAPDVQTKTKTLSSIAEEHNIKWEPKAFEEKLPKQNEDLLYGSATYSGGNIPTMGSSDSSMSTPQPPAPSYTSVESATSRMPTGPSYSSAEVSANRTPYGTVNSNAFSQKNRRGSDASVPPSSQHGTTTYSSAHIPGSNNFPHENTGGSSVSRPYSQYGATITDTMSRSEEINQPSSGSNWNVEFKDATSAAQAAAESARMASIAARAAAELASRGNFSAEQNTGAYESAAHSHETTPRKQQAEHLMKDDKRSFNEHSSGVNDPRVISSNARKDVERAEANCVGSQNMSTLYSAQLHSYDHESHSDVYGIPIEPPRAHSSEPPYFDDSSQKESNFGRRDDHPFDLPGEGLPDTGLGGRNIKGMESRQASFDQENTNTYYGNFSSFHGGSSTIWDSQNNKTGSDSSAVSFDQYESDVEEDILLDPFSSKHTEEPPTDQDHKGFSSADWGQQHRSESPVNHSTSTLFSRTETHPPYNLEANRKDVPSPHSYDNAPPTFDSDGVNSDEEITTSMHVESSRSHLRGSGFSENKEGKRISGKLAPDVNESIEDYESRSRKKYQNSPGFNAFYNEQHGDGSPRSDYSGAHGNLGRVQSRDYDLSEEETELHKLKGASSEIAGANENQPLSFGKQTLATSDGNDEGNLGVNFGRLTPGLRNKLRQPPPYTKNSGDNMMPKQSLHKAAAGNEESVHSKENDTSFEQIADTPKSSRTTESSFGANYNSEFYDRNQSVGVRGEARSTMTRNYFESGDTGKLSERSGNAPSSLTNKISVGANSSQELHNEKTGIGARRETRPRNTRSYFDSDDSEKESEQQQTTQTKWSREQIQSRRTREVISDTRRDGRDRTGAQYADETETMPKETKTPSEAFSNSSSGQRREAPAYSRVPVQRPSPKPVRIEPPTPRGKSQEAKLNRSNDPENEENTETSAGTPKESTPKTAPAHVHPKLPTDYDSFAAHFMSLRTNRR